MCATILLFRRPDEYVSCMLTTPTRGALEHIYVNMVIITSFLILLCYACFVLLLRKLTISDEYTKSINRSLIIISLTVVLGYFSAGLIGIASETADLLELDFAKNTVHLTAGVFTNSSTTINFFVYYIISKEYREMFDKYLGIGRLKAMVSRSRPTAARSIILSTVARRKQICAA
ncbi:hypothetical protein GCK32_018286 [Trichostrongylus colubriformis]|uniref:G-protein coupled receptors family 1 profile domain-containing protein n=1 Tax=Trichostrongylus colubriformis TaxID=6319 RepID=A0AAN8IRG7_TRICO